MLLNLEEKIRKDLQKVCKKSEFARLSGFSSEFGNLTDPLFRSLWDRSQWHSRHFLTSDYLLALSESNSVRRMHFVIFKHGNEIVGKAVFQIVSYSIREGSYMAKPSVPLANLITKGLRRATSNQEVMICGNPYATGEHAFDMHPDLSPITAMSVLCKAITTISRRERAAGNPVSALVVKDFYPSSFGYAEALAQCGFKSFTVDHNMVLPLLESWTSFDDYLGDMTTKFRTKALSALRKSESLRTEIWNGEQILAHQSVINKLYKNVHDKADFRLGELRIRYFSRLVDTMGDKAIFKAYFLDEQMIGFAFSIVGDEVFEAHIVGLDYEKNRDFSLYPRMLCDFVEIAITNRSKAIVFGRTAGEIKSTMGAIGVDLKCCIRHPQRLSNLLVNLLFSYIKPTDFPVRQPFKQATEVLIRQRIDAISL
jgi:predicted N-acyltransferase